MSTSYSWLGKSCFVTGTASGIGLATSRRLLDLGANVYGIDKVSEEEFRTNFPELSKVFFFSCDLSNPNEIKKVFGDLEDVPISALFNIAAVPAIGKSIIDLSVDEWDQLMAVNLRSIFLTSKYALPLFELSNGGAIVNVSSVHAYATMENHSAYAASKGGVNALTAELALELNHLNIRVTAVAPGSINTPMTTKDISQDKEHLESLGFPTDGKGIAHVGRPEEIAEALIWLASPNASFINGTTLIADAGLLARLTRK